MTNSKMMRNLPLSILLALSTSASFAQVAMPGQSDSLNYLDGKLNQQGASEHVRDADHSQINFKNSTGESAHVRGASEQKHRKEAVLNGIDQSVPNVEGNSGDKFREFTAEDLYKKIYNKQSYAFSFAYLHRELSSDNPEYDNIFDSDGSHNYGGLYIHFDYYLIKKNWVEFGYLGGAGVYYQTGDGHFADGTASDTEFKLWTIPVELHGFFEIPVASFAKLQLSAGPAAMLLMQNRNDYEEDEKGKDINQVSIGYSLRAKLKLSVGAMNKKYLAKLFRSQEITNYYVTVEGRYESFSNFQDDYIDITGPSIGIGFSFDFM